MAPLALDQQFEAQCEVVFDSLGKFPKELDKLKTHTTRQALLVFQMNLELTDLSIMMENYIIQQRTRLIVRNALHSKCIRQYNDLQSNINEVYDRLHNINLDTDSSPNRFVDTKEYDESMALLGNKLKKSMANGVRLFKRLTDLLSERFKVLETLNDDIKLPTLTQCFNQGKSDWLKVQFNKTTIQSFRKECKGLQPKDVYQEKKELKRLYDDNPIVKKLHQRLCSDMEQLVLAIRKGDYTEAQLTGYYEYLHKLDILDSFAEIESPNKFSLSSSLSLAEDETINHCLKHQFSTPQRISALKNWVIDCITTDQNNPVDHIDITHLNQFFILYYCMLKKQLMNKAEVPLCVKQIAEFCDGIIPTNDKYLKKIEKAIYDELEHWKKQDGTIVPYSELSNFITLYIGKHKAKVFAPKLKYAYLTLQNLMKTWQNNQ